MGVTPSSATWELHVLGQIIEMYLGLDSSSVKWKLINTDLVELWGHNQTTCVDPLAWHRLQDGYNYEVINEEDSCSLGKCAFCFPIFFPFSEIGISKISWLCTTVDLPSAHAMLRPQEVTAD